MQDWKEKSWHGQSITMTEEEMRNIFSWWVDYWLLLAEQERESEELADAFQWVIISKKYSMPSHIAPRRQLHSEKRVEAKKQWMKNFIGLVVEKKWLLSEK